MAKREKLWEIIERYMQAVYHPIPPIPAPWPCTPRCIKTSETSTSSRRATSATSSADMRRFPLSINETAPGSSPSMVANRRWDIRLSASRP